MLELNYIRENPKQVVAKLDHRNFPEADRTITTVIDLDETRRSSQLELDNLLARSNQLSKEIGNLFKSGKKDEANQLKQESADIKEKTKQLQEQLNQAVSQIEDILKSVPNLPDDAVPAGKTADANEIVYEKGSAPKLHEEALPHWDLASQYKLIDFELGTKLTGAGFPVYLDKGARLQRALINFFLDRAREAGYTEVQPPVVINSASGLGTGQLPDKDGQMYRLTDEDFYLIPTAEVPITNMYRDVILDEKDLPVKNVGYTPCFRREAGSWGAHVRGLNRLHQFDKVEIVQISLPENSPAVLEEMCNHVENLLASLQLPYRKLKLCTGDLGFTASITFDFEVYSTAQKRWLEVSSVSNFKTYQSNRLKLRYKKDGKSQLLHTLNGSALALPRILAAILENNQKKTEIEIPDVLVPYTGFGTIEK